MYVHRNAQLVQTGLFQDFRPQVLEKLMVVSIEYLLPAKCTSLGGREEELKLLET